MPHIPRNNPGLNGKEAFVSHLRAIRNPPQRARDGKDVGDAEKRRAPCPAKVLVALDVHVCHRVSPSTRISDRKVGGALIDGRLRSYGGRNAGGLVRTGIPDQRRVHGEGCEPC